MPLSEDFVWSLKMIVEAGGVDRLARALSEVGKAATGAQNDLVDLGEKARDIHVGNLLPEASAIKSRTEAMTRFKEQIASAFAVVRQNQGDFKDILQFDSEKPLRAVLAFQHALQQLKSDINITPTIDPDFQVRLQKIIDTAQNAAATRIKDNPQLASNQKQVEEQEIILGLLKAQDKEFKSHLATSQSNLRVLQQEQVAIEKFNQSLDASRGQRRVRQAEEAAKLQGVVGIRQEPLKNELRAALVEEQRRLQTDRRATLLAQVEGLPEESRGRARRRIENDLQIKDKNEIAAIDAKILKLETEQIEKADRLTASLTKQRLAIDLEFANLVKSDTRDEASIRNAAQLRLEQERTRISQQFKSQRRQIETDLPLNDPERNRLLDENRRNENNQLALAELKIEKETTDEIEQQNKRLADQERRIQNVANALQKEKLGLDLQFANLTKGQLGNETAIRSAAQVRFQQERERILNAFATRKRDIEALQTTAPRQQQLNQDNRENTRNALTIAKLKLEHDVTEEIERQNALYAKQQSEVQHLNESLVQRNLESRARLNQFEVQTSKVSADAKIEPFFRNVLTSAAVFQNALDPTRLFKIGRPREEAHDVANDLEQRLQQRLDQGVIQQKLAQAKVLSERRRALAEISAIPEQAIDPNVRAVQISTVEQTATHSLRAIAAEFTPTTQKIKFFNEEISRLAVSSAKFRQISFDLGILSHSFIGIAAAAIGVLGTGGQQLTELSIRLGAFNAIAKQTPEELSKTQDAVVRLFGEVPVKNLDELGLALFNIQSSGFNAAESMQVLETSAKLATLGMTDTDHAAKFLVQTLKSFNLNTNDSGRVASQLTSILNLSVGEFQQVGQAIAKASASARLANQDLAALGGSFAVLTTAGGLTPRRAGERISQLFRDLTQTRTRQQIGETLKFDIVGPEGVTRPIEEIIQAMVEARREGLLTQEAFNKIFTNSASREAALVLLNNFDKLKKGVKEVRNPAEEFEETFKRATENVGSQFQVLKNNFSIFSVAAASSLGPFVQRFGNIARGFGEFALQNKALISGLTGTVATIGLTGGGFLIIASQLLRFKNFVTDTTVGLLTFKKSLLELGGIETLRNKQLATENGLLNAQNAEILLNTELTIANARAKALAAGGASLETIAGGSLGAINLKTAGAEAQKAVGITAGTEALGKGANFAFGAINILTKGILGLTIAGTVAIVIGSLVEALRKAREVAVEDQKKEIDSYLKLSRQTNLTTEEELKLADARLRVQDLTLESQRILKNPVSSPLEQVAAEQFEARRTRFSGGFLGLGGLLNRLREPLSVRENLQASEASGGFGDTNPILPGNAGLRQIRELAKKFAEETRDAQVEALVTGNRQGLEDLVKVRALLVQRAKERDPKFEKEAEDALSQNLDFIRGTIIRLFGERLSGERRLKDEPAPSALESQAIFEQTAQGTPFERKIDLGQGLRGVANFLGKIRGQELNISSDFLTAGGPLNAQGQGPLNIDRLRELVTKQILPAIKIDTPENLEKAKKAGAILFDRLTGSFAFPGKGSQLTTQGNFPGVIFGRTVGLPVEPTAQVLEGKQPEQSGAFPEADIAFIRRQQQLQAEANVKAQIQTIVGTASDDFGRQLHDLEARFVEQQGRLRTEPALQREESLRQIEAEFTAAGRSAAAQGIYDKKKASAEATFAAQQRANRLEAFNLQQAHELALLDLVSRRAQEQLKITEQLHLQTLEAQIQLEQAGAFSTEDKIRIIHLKAQLDVQKLEFKTRDDVLDLLRQQTKFGTQRFGIKDVPGFEANEQKPIGQIEKTLLFPAAAPKPVLELPNTPTGFVPRTLPETFAVPEKFKSPGLPPTDFESLTARQQAAFSRNFLPEFTQEITRLFLAGTRTPQASIPPSAAHLGFGKSPFAPTLAGLQQEILVRMAPEDRAIIQPLLERAKATGSTTVKVRETAIPRTTSVAQLATGTTRATSGPPVLPSANLLGSSNLPEPDFTGLLSQQFAIQRRALELEGTKFGENGCALAVSAILSGSLQGLENLREPAVTGLFNKLTGLGAKVISDRKQARPGDVAFFQKGTLGDSAHTGVVVERNAQLGIEHNSIAAGHRLAFDSGILNKTDFFLRLPKNIQAQKGFTPNAAGGVAPPFNPQDLLAGINTAALDPETLKKVVDLLEKTRPNLPKGLDTVFERKEIGLRAIRREENRGVFEALESLAKERADLFRARDEAILAMERVLPRTERESFAARETEAVKQQTLDLAQAAEQRRRVISGLQTEAALGPRPGDVPSTVLAQAGFPGLSVQPENEEKARTQLETIAATELRIRRENNQKIFESRRDANKFEIDLSNKINDNERQKAGLIFFTSRLRSNGLAAEREQARELARLDTEKADREIQRITAEYGLNLILGRTVDNEKTSIEITAQQNEKLKIQQDLRQKLSDIESKQLAQELERQQLLLSITNQEQENARLFAGIAGPIGSELETAFQRASVANQINNLEAERVNLIKQAGDAALIFNDLESENLLLKAGQIERQQQGLRLTQQQAELNAETARRQRELQLFVRTGQLSQDQANLFQVQSPNLFRQAGESEDEAVSRQLEAIDQLRAGWIDHFQFLTDLYVVDREERLKNLRATLAFYPEESEEAERTQREITRLQLEDFQRLRSGLREAIGGGVKDFIVHPEQFNFSHFVDGIGQAIRSALADQFLEKTLFPLIGPTIDRTAAGATRQNVPDLKQVRAQAAEQGAFLRQKESEATIPLALSRSAQDLLAAASGHQIAAQALQIAAEHLSGVNLGGGPAETIPGLTRAATPVQPFPGLLPSAPLPLTLPSELFARKETAETTTADIKNKTERIGNLGFHDFLAPFLKLSNKPEKPGFSEGTKATSAVTNLPTAGAPPEKTRILTGTPAAPQPIPNFGVLSQASQNLLASAEAQQIAATALQRAAGSLNAGSAVPELTTGLGVPQTNTALPLFSDILATPLRLTPPPGFGEAASTQKEVADRQQRQSLTGIRFALREEVGNPLKESSPGGALRALTPLALALPAFLAGDTRKPDKTRPELLGLHDPGLTKLSQDLVLPASEELRKLIKPRVGDFTPGFGPGNLPDAKTEQQKVILGGKQTLGQLATAFAAFQAGVQGGALGGAVSGALTGAAFGPVGAIAGGLLGGLGGLFHKNKKPKEQFPFPALPNVEDVLFASKFFIHNAGEGGRQGLPVNNSESTDNSVKVGDINVTVHATSSDPNEIAKAAAAAVSREIGALR